MLSINKFLQNFIARAGNYVLLCTIGARLLSFLAAFIAIKFINIKELGVVIFAFNIISFFIPLGGFGLHQSLIRFGALTKSNEEKNNLFIYTFKKGLIGSTVLILLIIISSFFFNFSFDGTRNYLILLSLLIAPMYIFELIKIQFRLKYDNKNFAFAELSYNIILVVFVLILSAFYKEKGYATALLITPLLTSVLFFKKLKINFRSYKKVRIVIFPFFKYGFFASLSNVVTQLLFVIDIFLIGYLLNQSEMVTIYRYISLIPFSLLFLPRVFIATDFVAFTENIYNKPYIKNYIKGYFGFFTIVSFITLLTSLFFSKEILILFGIEFQTYSESFVILIFGTCGILIFRGLFGNLLSSIGKAHINFYITLLALILNIITNYYLIPKYGIKGAALTTAILMWFTGLISYLWFTVLYKKLLFKNLNNSR